MRLQKELKLRKSPEIKKTMKTRSIEVIKAIVGRQNQIDFFCSSEEVGLSLMRLTYKSQK